jgi:hypothetical protein
MTTKPHTISPAEALALRTLATPTAQGIASRVLARTAGGHLTLFAFAAGQELTEHTSPLDALVIVLEGSLALTIGGKELTAPALPASHMRFAPLSLRECSCSCFENKRAACHFRCEASMRASRSR